MIPTLACTALAAAAYLTLHLLVIARIVARMPPDIGIPAPPPVEPPPPLEPAGLDLVELVMLDDYTDAYLCELHAQLADDSYSDMIERCLHCGGRV